MFDGTRRLYVKQCSENNSAVQNMKGWNDKDNLLENAYLDKQYHVNRQHRNFDGISSYISFLLQRLEDGRLVFRTKREVHQLPGLPRHTPLPSPPLLTCALHLVDCTPLTCATQSAAIFKFSSSNFSHVQNHTALTVVSSSH